MSFLDGDPIEALADKPAEIRNTAATALLELALREIFDWGLVQTDPNFANYRYDPGSGKLILLDFGASRHYGLEIRESLRGLLSACVAGDDDDLSRYAGEVGYLGENDPVEYRDMVVMLLRLVTEPLRKKEDYDFGRSDLAQRMSDQLIALRLRSRYGRLPPPEVLFLHRKLGGMYLLLSRLTASVPVRALTAVYH